MFTQLSLFDAAVLSDTPGGAGFVHVAPRCEAAVKQAEPTPCCQPTEPVGRHRASVRTSAAAAAVTADRRSDEIRPMGELAQLVLARYDLLARRREEMERRRREQPRKSIRVLSPEPLVCR